MTVSRAPGCSSSRPALSDTFESNYAALEKDLAKLDREIKQIVANNQDLPLVASHPVYGRAES